MTMVVMAAAVDGAAAVVTEAEVAAAVEAAAEQSPRSLPPSQTHLSLGQEGVLVCS